MYRSRFSPRHPRQPGTVSAGSTRGIMKAVVFRGLHASTRSGAVIFVLAALVIAGCASNDEPSAVPRTSTTKVAPAKSTSAGPVDLTNPDDFFIAALNSYWTSSNDRTTLIAAGKAVCSQVRTAGKSAALGILTPKHTTANAENLVTAATMAYCPAS